MDLGGVSDSRGLPFHGLTSHSFPLHSFLQDRATIPSDIRLVRSELIEHLIYPLGSLILHSDLSLAIIDARILFWLIFSFGIV